MSVCTQMSEKSYVRSLGTLQQLQNCNRSREFVKNSSLNIFNLLKRVWLFTFYFFFVELNLTNWPISTRRVMRHLWKGGEVTVKNTLPLSSQLLCLHTKLSLYGNLDVN